MGLMIVLAVAGFFLTGCSGFTIDEDARIPLEKNAQQSGSQTDFDFLIKYSYVFRQADPQQPGELDLKFRLKRRRGFYSLSVYLNYLDGQGKVLGKNSIYRLGNRNRTAQVTEGPFETPPGTVAIAFTSVGRDFKSKQ
jgi:hypothetical protein